MVELFNSLFFGQLITVIMAIIIIVAKSFEIFKTWNLLQHNCKTNEDELKKLEFLSTRNLAFINLILIGIPLSFASAFYLYPERQIFDLGINVLIGIGVFLSFALVFEIITHAWITQKYTKLITKKK